MIKKFLSVILAVMMVVSVMTVGFVVTNAAATDGFTPDPAKLYFDVDGTGWTMGSKNKVAFRIYGGDFNTETNPTQEITWGTKKAAGNLTSGESTIYEIDPAAKLGLTLNEGVQYKIIFVRTEGNNWTDQTYDLFFTTDCLGHVAHSDGTMIENPVDSSKKTLAAYWDDSIDPAENGPVKGITSIGNVVGSCAENGKSDYDLLKEFFSEEKTDFQGKTAYQNAHQYVCEISDTSPNYKTEQKLIDDIGAGLGLTKDDVKEILESEEAAAKLAEGPDCAWNYDDSTLPGGSVHEHTPGEPVRENEVPATCKAEGSYDEVVYCTECGEELSREAKTIDKLDHTPGEPVRENEVPATCKAEGSYDEVVYCTVCGEELSREAKTIDKLEHTPGEAVKENEVPADCENDGSYDEVVYCTVCGDELSREAKTIDKLGHDLVFVEEVPATASVDGVKEHYECTRCGKLYADADGAVEVTAEDLVIKAAHVRGDANGDGVFDALDVTVLQRKLVELDVESFDEVGADADLDGVIDVIDVTLMQRVLANMTTFEKWDAKHAKA